MSTPTFDGVTPRPDLAAMLTRLARLTTNAELPVLRGFDLTMWEYVVLLGLAREPVRTQSALAEAIGADKTRIIEVLDAVQERKLITREPDASDRRVRLLALTAEGTRTLEAAQRAIQHNERILLDVLTDSERQRFLRNLQRLYEAAPDRLG
jgi:DNA-binding MarR family transcriptional regulator